MTSPVTIGYVEAGSGPVLLLVHGFPLDHSMWSEQLSALSDLRRVVAVDLRGRGKSPAEPNGWTMDDYADDLAATIDELGVDKADVAGMSMGGYVVLALWRRYPEKVRSLILIDTKASADSDEAKEGRDKTAALVREKGASELVEGLLPKLFGGPPDEELSQKVKAMFEATPGGTAAADALAMKDRPDSTVNLATITVPALVIHGEQDALMPIDDAKGMAGLIPGAKFVSVPGAGHMSPIENPKAVNHALRVFLMDR